MAAPPVGGTEPPDDTSTKSGPGTTFLGFVALFGIAVLATVILYRIYPGELADKTNPGFLDNIFNSNIVVFAARLILFSAALVLAFLAAHMIWSIVQWFRLGHLLTKIGPLQVSEHAIQTLQAELEFWQREADSLYQQVDTLSERLQESDELLEAVLSEDSDLDAEGTVEETPEKEEKQ